MRCSAFMLAAVFCCVAADQKLRGITQSTSDGSIAPSQDQPGLQGQQLRVEPSPTSLAVSYAPPSPAQNALEESPLPTPAPSQCPSGDITISISAKNPPLCFPSFISYALAAAAFVIGVFELGFGYKFFRTTLFLLGLTAAGGSIFIVMFMFIRSASVLMIAGGVGGACGLIVGGLGAKFPKAGIFVVGAGVGVFIGFILEATVLPNGLVFLILACVGGGIVCGVLCIFFMRIVMILATSLIGGYLAVRAIGTFAHNFPSEVQIVDKFINHEPLGLTFVPDYLYYGGALLTALVGAFVQLKWTAKKKKKGDKDEWESQMDITAAYVSSLTGRRKRSKYRALDQSQRRMSTSERRMSTSERRMSTSERRRSSASAGQLARMLEEEESSRPRSRSRSASRSAMEEPEPEKKGKKDKKDKKEKKGKKDKKKEPLLDNEEGWGRGYPEHDGYAYDWSGGGGGGKGRGRSKSKGKVDW